MLRSTDCPQAPTRVRKSVFESIALAVTSRPKIALIVLAAVTGVLVFGATLLGPQAGSDAFP